MKIEHKLIISYIGIILITCLLWMYFKKQQGKIQEGLKMPNFDKIIVKPIKKGFNDGIVKPLENTAKNAVKPLLNFFKDIRNAFKEMTVASNDLNKALDFLFTQGGKDFADIGKKTWDVTEITFKDIWISTVSVMDCIAKVSINIPSCFGFYIGHLTGYILYYLFIGLPIYLIYLMSGGFLDLEPTINDIFSLFANITMDSFGDQIKSVTSKCYTCKIIPMPKISAAPIIDAAQKMNYDFNYTIPRKFYNVKTDLNSAGRYLKKAFK